MSPEATAVPLICVLAATGVKDGADDIVSSLIHSLHPASCTMSILHTILYTFPKVLTRRICFKQLRASLVGDYFLFLMTSICDQGVIC